MKILITTESYPPNISGVAIFTEELAKYLVNRGHNVFVVCPGTERKNTKETKDNVVVYRIKSVSNPLRKNHKFILFPKRIIRKLIREINPDIVHLQDPAILALSAIIESKKQKIPVIITNHFMVDYINEYLGLPEFFKKIVVKIFTRYLRWFYGIAKVITCPTQTAKNYLLKLGIKTEIIPMSNGVNIKQFEHSHIPENLKKSFNISLDKKIIVFVGRLDKDKKVETLINAMPDVLIKINAYLLICGTGNAKIELEKLVAELKLENNVKFLGAIEHNEIDKYYRMGDVFVGTGPIETQGIVFMEAMATGLPVIGSNSGAVPELVRDRINGYLFEKENSKNLADKIILILSDDAKAESMGRQSKELIKIHNIDVCMNKFEKLYEKLRIKSY